MKLFINFFIALNCCSVAFASEDCVDLLGNEIDEKLNIYVQSLLRVEQAELLSTLPMSTLVTLKGELDTLQKQLISILGAEAFHNKIENLLATHADEHTMNTSAQNENSNFQREQERPEFERWTHEWAQHTRTLEHGEPIRAAMLSPDGSLVASISSTRLGELKVWRVSDQELLFEPKRLHLKPVNFLNFSPDGQFILTGSDDASAKLVDAKTGSVLHTFGEFNAPIVQAEFSPDGQWVLLHEFHSKSMYAFNVHTKKLIREFGAPSPIVFAKISPDSRHIGLILQGEEPRIVDVVTGGLKKELRRSQHSASSAERYVKLAFNFDGSHIMATSHLTETAVWNTHDESEYPSSELISTNYNSLISHPHKNIFIGNTQWGRTYFLVHKEDAKNNYEVRESIATSLSGTPLFSPDGQLLLTIENSTTIQLHHADTGEFAHSLKPHSDADSIVSYNFSADGQFLLTAANSGEIKIWTKKYKLDRE